VRLRRIEEGAIVVVTGASSGIGAALAERLVQRGARVIAAARRDDRLSALAQRLGSACLPIALDVTSRDSTATFLERLPEVWRMIDALVNNAGQDIGGKNRFDAAAAEQWIATIDVNLNGALRVSHALIPGMLSRGGGQIVNIGSTAGISAYPGGSAYVAGKFGVNGFSKALRLDYLGKIRIAEVLPGVVRTEFDETRRHGDKAKAQEFYASFAACLNPEDVAECVLFVLSQPAHVNIAELLVMPSA
jgi:3-hydroxy acid dehydrogenase/malonic semialdehyde reductase